MGVGIGCTSAAACLVTLAAWHRVHCLHHSATSLARCGHKKRLPISCLLALIPGCAREWMASKICFLNAAGTSGRKTPLDVSTSKSVPARDTLSTLSTAEFAARLQSGQPGCAAAKAASSTGLFAPGAAADCATAAAVPCEEHEGGEHEGGEHEGGEHEGGEHEGGEHEGVEHEGGEHGGLDSVSATTFALPAMCLISDTNSVMKANCRRCRSDFKSATLFKAPARGLWSEKTENRRPSNRCLK
jgi:hypothetical protein